MATGQYLDEPVAVSPTLGGIVHLSDQLSAAVYEIEAAWTDFVNGSRPESGAGAIPEVPHGTRLEITRDSINGSIGRLRMLTASIRELS